MSLEVPAQTRDSGLPSPVLQVLSMEVKCYKQHVYSHDAFSYYIKGRFRGGHVTLKKYQWEVNEEIQQEQFRHEICSKVGLLFFFFNESKHLEQFSI